MNKRCASFEYMRILAMCMIIAMHYMTKGMMLPKLSVDASAANHLWWLFYGFCLVAPNAYVLISGYFLVDRWNDEWQWKSYISRAVRLLAEVLFYSWIVPLVLGAFGVINLGALDFQTKITVLLPISEEHYWFATSYLLLYLLSPVLSKGINAMNREQHKAVMIAMLVALSGVKSVCPYLIPTDHYGCDVYWFVELFIIAAYIKRYGIAYYKSFRTSLFTYIGAVAAYMVECSLVAALVRMTGKLEYFMDMVYSYNHVLVVIASVSFFYMFVYMKNVEGKIISKLGGYTFGVYLLHENLTIREQWYQWLGIGRVMGCWYQFFHMIFCVIVVMMVGIFVDFIRRGIFGAVTYKKSKV